MLLCGLQLPWIGLLVNGDDAEQRFTGRLGKVKFRAMDRAVNVNSALVGPLTRVNEDVLNEMRLQLRSRIVVAPAPTGERCNVPAQRLRDDVFFSNN
jgi:hypothetical protein